MFIHLYNLFSIMLPSINEQTKEYPFALFSIKKNYSQSIFLAIYPWVYIKRRSKQYSNAHTGMYCFFSSLGGWGGC